MNKLMVSAITGTFLVVSQVLALGHFALAPWLFCPLAVQKMKAVIYYFFLIIF